jgi:uncharacterized protein
MYDPSVLHAQLGSWEPVEPGSTSQMAERMLWDSGDVQVGIWEVTPGRFANHLDDFDEMMFMVSGRLTVTQPDGADIDVAPGTLWVTPRHFPCDWTVHQTVRKVFVIDNRPGGPSSLAVEPNVYVAPMGPETPYPGIVVDDCLSAETTIWSDNGIDVGLWSCTTGIFDLTFDGFDEVIHILSGHGRITGPGGFTIDLMPGTTAILPNGLATRWEITEDLRKVFCVINR